MSSGSPFLQCWLIGHIRDAFLSHIYHDDLPAVRLTCHDFSLRAAPLLFRDLTITFRTSSFTRPARMAAIERIGHHVRKFTFNAPHTPETFIPPLLDPVTGEEQAFIYAPRKHLPVTPVTKAKIPKYGSWEITDLLIKQYSPLFHAATDVSSFIRAFSAMPLLAHLVISCSGQDSAQKYRRSTVDYALISLRMAIEKTSLPALSMLSLSLVHPAAVFYLRPTPGFGTLPNSMRRWAQIRDLSIEIDNGSSPCEFYTDHVKLLNSYLQIFSRNLRALSFRWNGTKGPCPLSLNSEPCLTDLKALHVSDRMQQLRFHNLKYMEVENASMDASQISTFIMTHRRTIKEFNFEDIALRTGSWDEALAPLTRISGSEKWKDKQLEVMDVPIVLRDICPSHPTIAPRKAIVEPQERKRIWTKMKTKAGLEKGANPATRLEKASSRGLDLLKGTPEHVRKFLRSSVLSWR